MTRGGLYEIIVNLVEPGTTRRFRLSLLFRPAEVMFLTHALQVICPIRRHEIMF